MVLRDYLIIKLVLFISDEKICILRRNKIVSIPFLRQIFNFLSFLLKRQARLQFVLEKTWVSRYIPLQGKQKYQITKLTQRANCYVCLGIIEFAVNENHRKTPE